MPKIHFIREEKIIEMKPLSMLWDAKKEDIEFVKEPNCGGQGRCQKCKCLVNGVERISCMEKVYKDDLEIETLLYYKND